MFLEGRPPVNVGVTSGGDVFGGTQVTFTRRARRQAVQHLRRVGLAVPHAVGLVHEPVAPLPVRAAGLLADAVLLRAARRRLLRPGATRRSSTATWRSPRSTVRGGTRLRHLPAQPLPPPRAVRRRRAATTSSTTTRRSQAVLAATTSSSSYGQHAVPQRHVDAARRRVRAGDDGLPRVRAAGRQHDAARRTRSRRRSATRCRARRVDVDARYYLRLGGTGVLALRAARLQELGRLPGLHLLRRQLRDARLRLPRVRRPERRSSPTPNCASRSSRRC